MLLTMVTSKVKNICCITFQSSNDLGHEVFVLIIVPIVGDASRSSVEGLTHTLSIAGFTIKLQDVDFVIDSTFLFVPSLSYRGVRHSSGATTASGFRATVTGFTLRSLFTSLPSTTPLAVFFLGVTASVVAPSSSKV